MTILPRLSFSLLLTAALISGCSSPQKPPQVVDKTATAKESIDDLLRQAQTETPVTAAQLRLRAAQIMLQEDQPEQALATLTLIDLEQLPPELAFEVARVRAPLDTDNTQELMRYLDPSRFGALPADQQAELAQLRADVWLQQDDPLAAARELMLSSQLSIDPAEQQRYHNQIWQVLQRVPQPQLRASMNTSNDYFEQGWLELALMLRQSTDLPTREQALNDWRILWESHPAMQLPPEDLMVVEAAGELISANRIGVVLPLSGNLAKPAAAIREGMEAALEVARQQGKPTPTLVNIDSSQLFDASQIMLQARQLNVDFLIGPLDNTLIQQLSSMPQLDIPVLALNSAPAGPSTPWQLELSSEHEARTLAQKAVAEGHKRFLVITPGAPWGDRVRDSLTNHVEQVGGQVVGTLGYDVNANYDAQIAQLMKTDASKAREQSLRELLRHSLEFQERRRKDADAILLTALPEAARLIKPMLDYHFAADMPIYATSHLYPGDADATRDVDLNGIQFCDLPWILQPPSDAHRLLSSSGKNTLSRFGRLYALGVDAINIYPWLEQLQLSPGVYIDGETGRLQIMRDRQLQRELTCTRFEQGMPLSITEGQAAEIESPNETGQATDANTDAAEISEGVPAQ